MKLEPVVFTIALERLMRDILNAIWGVRHVLIGTALCILLAVAAHADPVRCISGKMGTVACVIDGKVAPATPVSKPF